MTYGWRDRPYICENCGKVMEGWPRRDKKFCSNACRQKAHRMRRLVARHNKWRADHAQANLARKRARAREPS